MRPWNSRLAWVTFFCLMVATMVANAPVITGGIYLTTDQVTDEPLGQSSETADVGQATFADESSQIDLVLDSMGSDVLPYRSVDAMAFDPNANQLLSGGDGGGATGTVPQANQPVAINGFSSNSNGVGSAGALPPGVDAAGALGPVAILPTAGSKPAPRLAKAAPQTALAFADPRRLPTAGGKKPAPRLSKAATEAAVARDGTVPPVESSGLDTAPGQRDALTMGTAGTDSPDRVIHEMLAGWPARGGTPDALGPADFPNDPAMLDPRHSYDSYVKEAGIILEMLDQSAAQEHEAALPAGEMKGPTSLVSFATPGSTSTTSSDSSNILATNSRDLTFVIAAGPNQVPEPTSLALLSVGLAGLAWRLRK